MKTKLISVLLLMSIILSCRKDQQSVKSNLLNKSNDSVNTLSLSEVKDWYNRTVSSTDSQTINSLSASNERRTFSLKSLAFNWDKLQSFTNKKGNYWLGYLPGQPLFRNAKQGYRKVAFLKDSTGRIQARILEIIPDGLYYQRKQKAETKDFTGRVFIFDASYHFLGGKVYSGGKQIGSIKSQTKNTTSTQLRTLEVQISEDCQWNDSNYVDSEGILTVYSEYDCSYMIYDDGFYPDMGGGGGGSPSGDPLGSGGGGGGDVSSAPDVANLPGEDHSKVDPTKYMNCFGSVPDANATMTVTVYVQEPFPGTTFNYGPNSVGHTAIGLTKTSGNVSVTQTLGFYPDASGKDKMHAPGKLVDNTGLNYDVSISFNVDALTFANMINYLNSSLPNYDISAFNCTGFAYDACQYAGINLPNPYTTVGLPYPGGAQGMAMTPAGLGNSIQNMQGKPGVNTNGGNIPTSHGPCN
jgi:hypothetical protein